MKKQDKCGVRTPSELERKYDFGSVFNGEVSYAALSKQINLLNQTLAQFMTNTNAKFEAMEATQTHFYEGVPTLENLPASEWETNEVKQEHIGDMYFDTNTGHTYLFKLTNEVFEWVDCLANYYTKAEIDSMLSTE